MADEPASIILRLIESILWCVPRGFAANLSGGQANGKLAIHFDTFVRCGAANSVPFFGRN